MDRRKFFIGCLCCAAAAATVYKSGFKLIPADKNSVPWSYPREDLAENFIPHIEIHLVEHCNIGCKFCSHFSTVAEKKFYDVTQYEKDIARLSEVTGQNLLNLELLGGEPLLHPQLNDLLRISRKYFPKTNIELLTNATLLNTMPEAFWLTIKENNIFLLPTIYPLKINWEKILKKAQKYGVQITDDDQQHFLTLDNIKDYTVEFFYKVHVDPKGRQNKNNSHCIFKNTCVQYIDGKLYPCFVASNIIHFNKRFNQKVPVSKNDYLDVYKTNSLDDINRFLNKQNIDFCAYCAGVAPSGERWSSVNNHTIEEWLYNKEETERER